MNIFTNSSWNRKKLKAVDIYLESASIHVKNDDFSICKGSPPYTFFIFLFLFLKNIYARHKNGKEIMAG